MSHFYAKISNSTRKHTPTARGSKSTGITTVAAAWSGATEVTMCHNQETGLDEYSVAKISWPQRGKQELLVRGTIQ
jgi:hypothetical protein